MPDIYLKDKNGIPRKYEDISAVRFVGDPLGTEYVTYSESASLIALIVNPSRSSQHIEPPTGYTGFSEVTVNPVTNVTADNIKAGQTILDVTGTYTASNNPITASDVLSGKEGFVNGGSVIVGNMPNNGAGSWTLDDVADLPLSISPGYYSSGTITIDSTSLTNLAAGNIKKDVEILGVTGSYVGEAISSAPVVVVPAVTAQTILPADRNTDYFDEADVEAIPYETEDNSAGGYTIEIARSYTKFVIQTTANNVAVPIAYNQSIQNGITIDWGDGSSATTPVGSLNRSTPYGLSYETRASHTYSEAGVYKITFIPDHNVLWSPGRQYGSNNYYNIFNKDWQFILSAGTGEPTNVKAVSFDGTGGILTLGMCSFKSTSLTSFKVSNSILNFITYSSFENCTSLTTVELPVGVCTMESKTFAYCPNLSSFKIKAPVPPVIYNNTFEATNVSCPIYVPASSVQDYKTTQYWSNRASYIQAIP